MKKMQSLGWVVFMMFLVYPISVMSAVPVTSGLVLQLDTSDITTDGSGNVQSWNDQSGNNLDAVQAASGSQPTLVSGITPAGGSAVRFDGTSDYLDIVPNSIFDGGTWTIFAVYAVDIISGTGSQRIVNLGYADIDPSGTTKINTTTYSMAVGGSAGVRGLSRDVAGGFIAANSGVFADYATDTFYIAAMTNDSGSGNVTSYFQNQANEVLTMTTPGATAVGSGNSVARIGAGTSSTTSTDPGTYLNGWVSEVLVYNRVLTSQEITDVSAYLDSKHLVNLVAAKPNPANGVYAYDQNVTLGWTPSTEADSQMVYFSTDFNNVNDSASAALIATLGGAAESYGTVEVKMSGIYYWRVNHIADGSTVYGPVWTFNVPAYYRFDDFEDYTGTGSSSASGTLRSVWKDGYSLAGEGLSQLGANVAMVADAATADMFTASGDQVRTLAQSMLFAFDNTGNEITFTYPSGAQAIFTPAYPYAEAKVLLGSLPIGTDWTIQGDWVLEVYFYGQTANATNSPLYLVLEDATGQVSTPLVYPTSSDIAVAEWHKWSIPSSELETNNVDLSNLSKLYIGFGNRNTPAVGGKGIVYFDDLRIHRAPKLPTDLNADCKIDILDFSLLALDWLRTAGCSN